MISNTKIRWQHDYSDNIKTITPLNPQHDGAAQLEGQILAFKRQSSSSRVPDPSAEERKLATGPSAAPILENCREEEEDL
jgi:hypothetical protein